MATFRILTLALGLAAVVGLIAPPPAQAGCGCDKPPPLPAQVRPRVTYAGADVTLFHPDLQPGAVYTVEFVSGTTPERASVEAAAVSRQDLADGTVQPQLVVAVPNLPLGPTGIVVRPATPPRDPVVRIEDDDFTLAPPPVVIPEGIGMHKLDDFQAAVGRSGTVYLALDLSQVREPKVLRAQAKRYPLRFSEADIAFYNTQGILMQLLDGSIPGLFTICEGDSGDSTTLVYSRHEFNSFFLQHGERQPHALSDADPNWHADGTAHIDHDHLILALAGRLADGSLPVPGATPPFRLDLRFDALFQNALRADSVLELEDRSSTDSYNSAAATTSFSDHGDIFCNGSASLSGRAVVRGDATAASIRVRDKAQITVSKTTLATPEPLLPVYTPRTLPELGDLRLGGTQLHALAGPASYHLTSLTLEERAELVIDNAGGPVTLYVDGPVSLEDDAAITATSADPDQLAIYVRGPHLVALESTAALTGVVYAPDALVQLGDGQEVFGAVVGYAVSLEDMAAVHYDGQLKKKTIRPAPETPPGSEAGKKVRARKGRK